MNSKWRLTLGLALATTYFGAGCANDVGDIDRTNPNKIEKALFQNDDEWYFRQTVVDTDVQGTGIFEGLEGSLYRIRWTITEDRLLAYSTTEPVENAYDGQTADENIRVGLVAAFPIKRHFDVQRGYNASTGEQSNVISENGSDRNWYDRKFMRVDWSNNMASAGLEGFLGRMAATSRDVPQDDGKINPDRVRISDEYIEAVTEYEFDPDIYACYYTFGGDGIWSCQAGPLKVRNSFLKLNKTKTYEPIEYLDTEYIKDEDGKRVRSMLIQDTDRGLLYRTECTKEAQAYDRDRWGASEEHDECDDSTFDFFKRFGYFRTERVFWDPDYGSNNEASRLYYANRWNIWQTMFNEKGELLPMAERVAKPIIYHTNVGYPKNMFGAAQKVAQAWNDIFMGATSEAKGITEDALAEEIKASGFEAGAMYEIRWNSCSAPMVDKWNTEFGSAKGSDVNSVSDLISEFKSAHDGDSLEDSFWSAPTDARRQLCAELEYATEAREKGNFTWQRMGDLRYSFFNWVEEANNFWSGYGPSAADPVTGQIISGNANFAGWSMRGIAARYADLVQYQNGDLDQDVYELGGQRHDYLTKIKKGILEQRQPLTKEGKKEMAQRVGADWRHFDEGDDAPLPEFLLRRGAEKMQAEAGRMAKADWLHKSSDTRMADFYNRPEVKNLVLADPNFRLLVESRAVAQFGPNFNDDQFHQAYLGVKAPNLDFDRYQRLNSYTSERNILLPNVIEDQMMTLATYTGIADRFKGKPRAELVEYILQKSFYGIQLHEVGHTFGLRHNFGGSYDAMNYDNEFWKIQKAAVDGNLAMEERNSITKAKAKELGLTNNGDIEYVSQAEFRSASVMDYGADITDRYQGLGKYDRAAIYFAYANKVERFKDTVKLPNFVENDLFLDDYTELPFTLAGHRSIPAAADQAAAYAEGIDALTNGREWISVQEAMEEQRQGLKKNTNDFKENVISDDVWQDRTVPYNFCTDDRRGYQLGCEAGDWGSNQREVVNHKFDKYRTFQPLLRYSGGKINKFYENINRYARFVFGTLKSVERAFRFYSIYQFFNLQDFLDDLRDASIDAINFYAEVIAMPEPGRFCKFNSSTSDVDPFWYFGDTLENTYVPSNFSSRDGECSESIDIEKGAAQFYNYSFTGEYNYRATYVGTYIDKSMATSALFQISSNTVNSAFFTDQRATAISYWTLFQDELYDWMRGIIIGDYSGFTGVYDVATGEYIPPKLIDQKKFGTGLPNGQKNMPRVYTNMSFNHEFNMLVGAMLNFTNWQDRSVDFSQYLKVSVTNGESQDYPAGTVLHQFVHPKTNQIYTAPEAEDGRSITAELIDYATILGQRYEAEKATLDATPAGDGHRAQRDIVENLSDQLQEIVSKLDTMRFIFEVLGQDSLR